MKLVERMRGHAHSQEESDQGRTHPVTMNPRSSHRAKRNVAQMPRRVGRVQQRQNFATDAPAARVERGAVKVLTRDPASPPT